MEEAISGKPAAAREDSVNPVIVVDELDKIDYSIDIDAAECGDLFFDYSRLIDIETLSFEINKLTKVRRRKKTAPAVKPAARKEVIERRKIEFAETIDEVFEAGTEIIKEEILEEAVPPAVKAETAEKEPAPAEPVKTVPGEVKSAQETIREGEKVVIIDIPEEFKKQLSEIISFEELGRVNLKEAEQIAEEDIFFLAGEELLEELEELDIKPEGDAKSRRKDTASGIKALEESISAAQKLSETKTVIAEPDAEKVKPSEKKAIEPDGESGTSSVDVSERAAAAAALKTGTEEVPASEEAGQQAEKAPEGKTLTWEKLTAETVKSSAEEFKIEEIPDIDDIRPASIEYTEREEKIFGGESNKEKTFRTEERFVFKKRKPEEKVSGSLIKEIEIEKRETSYEPSPSEKNFETEKKLAIPETAEAEDESEIEEMKITLNAIDITPAEEIDIDESELDVDFISDKSGDTKKVKSSVAVKPDVDQYAHEKKRVSEVSLDTEKEPILEEVLYTEEKAVEDILDEMDLSDIGDETILLDDKLEKEDILEEVQLTDEDLINIEDKVLTDEKPAVKKEKAGERLANALSLTDSDTEDILPEPVMIRDELDKSAGTESLSSVDTQDIKEAGMPVDFMPVEEELISEEISFGGEASGERKTVLIEDEIIIDSAVRPAEEKNSGEGMPRIIPGKIEDEIVKIDESAIKVIEADEATDEKELQNIDITVLNDTGEANGTGIEVSFDDDDLNIFADQSEDKLEEKESDVMIKEREEKQKSSAKATGPGPRDNDMETITEPAPAELEEIDITGAPADMDETPVKHEWSDLARRGMAGEGKVFIIDDEPVKKPRTDSGIKTEEEKLSEIVSVIVDLVRGEAKQLDISTSEEETYLTIEAPVKFEDFHAEAEEKTSFIDNDIDFVDSVFLAGEKAAETGTAETAVEKGRQKTVSPEGPVDIDSDEMDLIEGSVFGSDEEIIEIGEDSLDIFEEESAEEGTAKKLKYILPATDSLSDEERISIEEDIESGSALILEEDVEEIKEKLDFIMKKKIEDSIQDITEKIRIIEDDGELKESIRKMVLENRDDLSRLMKYMDGLLGKLPEGEIKGFADSEYYDLYLKVLKEMNK